MRFLPFFLILITFVALILGLPDFARAASPAGGVVLGPLLGEIVLALAGLLAAPVALFLVGLLVKAGAWLGFQIEEGRRARLQDMVENGIRAGAADLGVALDGRLSVELRSAIAAHAADYVARHGAETLRKLRESPDDQDMLRELVLGRGGALLGVDPNVIAEPVR